MFRLWNSPNLHPSFGSNLACGFGTGLFMYKISFILSPQNVCAGPLFCIFYDKCRIPVIGTLAITRVATKNVVR